MNGSESDTLTRASALLETYKPSAETVRLVQQTPIVVLVGIAGAGKDSIKHKLLETNNYHHIVSHTTRAPRENQGILERDGEAYHFITFNQAAQMLQNGAFVEAKLVHRANIYGTSAVEIQKAHDDQKIAITDIEVQGVAEYKTISSNVIAIFILPPNYEIWQERLLKRYGSAADKKEITERMRTAKEELEQALRVDYYHFVVNDDLGQAVEVADKIAHNGDIFNEKDDLVRAQAKKLLASINERLSNL